MPLGAKDGVHIVPSMYTLTSILLSLNGEQRFFETGSGMNNTLLDLQAPSILEEVLLR